MTPLQRLAEAVLSDPARARELAAQVRDRNAADKAARKKRQRAKTPHAAVLRDEGRATAKREERRAKVAAIREVVFARWEGECALCPAPATDLHHVISGPLRRKMEAPDTTLPVCPRHHGALHRGDIATLEDALYACDVACMPRAVTALARRITKIQASRASRAQHHEGDSESNSRLQKPLTRG